MTQNALSDEIERILNTYAFKFLDYYDDGSKTPDLQLYSEHHNFLRQALRSIAEKTVEAVRVEPIKVCGCAPFQSTHSGYCSSPDPGWEQYNQAVTEQSKNAQEWLGKDI